ncbi:hypothetical protein AOLI_G00128750 [Acnodon oligacanthus]
MEVRTRRKSLLSLRRGPHRRDAICSEESPELHSAGDQQTLASALLDRCLVTWLKDSALGLWLCESTTQLMDSRVVSWLTSTPQAKLFRLLFWAVLCLLLVWLLSDLHLGLPCSLLGLFYWIYNVPVMRGMSQAWVQWRAGQ